MVGAGYVGLSNAVLLAQHNEVVVLDIDANKINLINHKKSTIEDKEIEDFLANKPFQEKINYRVMQMFYDNPDSTQYELAENL